MLARIANFDEFDPLRMEPDVRLVFVRAGEPLPIADLVILPGSKATIADLAFFREQGWHIDLLAHARRGGRVLGVCGGYQMLGRRVADPQGIEGPPGAVEGLGLLDVETVLTGEKTLGEVEGERHRQRRSRFAATKCMSGRRRAQTAPGRFCASPTDGSTARPPRTASSPAPMSTGCSPTTGSARRGSIRSAQRSEIAYEATVERTLDELADHCAAHLDLDAMLRLAR